MVLQVSANTKKDLFSKSFILGRCTEFVSGRKSMKSVRFKSRSIEKKNIPSFSTTPSDLTFTFSYRTIDRLIRNSFGHDLVDVRFCVVIAVGRG